MTLVAPTIADYEASADLTALLVRTTQDDALSVSAETLRLSCKCAHCTRARFDDHFPDRFPGIAITEIGDLGYGLNISFSDGHNRGIYPKPYLLSLAGQ
ncbi:MAG: gamma-butyrobetaine hydroxylase-like domain-containing protein [Bradyrhizobium sp.]|uniref:gamma-butyrobetaine hydroxylase-like domain-containing protein n=1 Tax=Bradyrhizobium sp. TaxID=376 RepID=UPI0029B19989|nr:gamma-butyrobetaine hydroxylase-like domain-containing protein [Bradyrhizobium sp.]MDX3965214.1 gamma-butyrobetaine hydroxylase-like domain-containing protein [Bradyrhizobium sp.]